MGGQIFISYRRQESLWSARSLHDRLCRDFDPNQIFMDLDAIALGEDFIEAIETTVARCDVLIAVIGNNWLTSKDDRGGRRLDNADDFVRMEIATALRRRIRVIPVLVDGVVMPRADDLPEDLKLLVRRNVLAITGASFVGDCERLAAAIRQVLEKAATRETPSAAPLLTLAQSLSLTQTASSDVEFLIDREIWNDRDLELLRKAEYEELLNGCDEWIAYNWDDRAYAMRAIVYYYKKGYDQAISDFDTAISQAPENAGYYYNRGVAYRKMGKNTEAQADFDKAKQLGYTVPQ
jgi:hypothetical protein